MAFQLKAAKYTFFFQVDIKQSPGLSTYWASTQTMVNLIKLKTYTENKTESIFITISYRNQLQEKSCKKHKYMKAKQYATKSPNEK